MGAQSGLASSSCNTDVNNRKVPATLLRDGNTCVIMSKPEGVRCPGLPQGSDQRIHCLAIQHVTSLSGWDSEATALTVPVSGHTGGQAASEATVSLGSLRPPLRNIKLKRRCQALFPTAPASQRKRLHVTSEATSHSSTVVQEAKQACDEVEDGEEECQSRPKLLTERGLPPITAGALTYPFPTAAHSAWSQRLRAAPGSTYGRAELPMPPAHACVPPTQVWPALLQPSLARFLLTKASDVHAAEASKPSSSQDERVYFPLPDDLDVEE